ncbi:hypothetical protein J7T55_009799 [Diaporthe amygdali]|uniref:uncharacterized protein n=1 Tax=Phomopsis amygdali TaxID=1214568 RepID=UPI0022FEB844|nr:uncharacterized protein J7T55_009799 [Diaporthe amygdali]KAJ0116649.1 hypothetical protein J7T55_009799 [Diaporthe amygdali]
MLTNVSDEVDEKRDESIGTESKMMSRRQQLRYTLETRTLVVAQSMHCPMRQKPVTCSRQCRCNMSSRTLPAPNRAATGGGAAVSSGHHAPSPSPAANQTLAARQLPSRIGQQCLLPPDRGQGPRPTGPHSNTLSAPATSARPMLLPNKQQMSAGAYIAYAAPFAGASQQSRSWYEAVVG